MSAAQFTQTPRRFALPGRRCYQCNPAGLAPPTYALDFPIKRDVVGMARRPTAVDVRWRVLCNVAFIAMMRCLPGKDRRGSQNHDQDRN